MTIVHSRVLVYLKEKKGQEALLMAKIHIVKVVVNLASSAEDLITCN